MPRHLTGPGEVGPADETSTPDDVVAVVLCGGLGTRLRSLTGEEIPKPLYPLAGKPIIEHSIEPLVQAGIARVVLATAFKDDVIREHFRANYQPPADSRTRIDFTNQRVPTGVLHAVCMALGEHRASIVDSVIVCDGDAIRRGLDVGALYSFHKASGRNTTFVTTKVDRTERHWGIVGDGNGDLAGIVPFPPTGSVPGNVVFTGCMMLDTSAAATLRDMTSDDPSWTGMAALVRSHGSVNLYHSDMDYFNLNSPDVVDEALRMLRGIGGTAVQRSAECTVL